MKRNIIYLLSLVLLCGLLSGFGWGFGSKYKTIEAQSGVFKIPLKDVSDGKAHYFKTKLNGKEIKFFALKSSDGVVRVAFDACDVCYPAKKGYRQDGEYMICNNCNQRFHSKNINVLKGGCNPSPVRRLNDGKFVNILASDVASGAFYF
jgi:uncharacterized membrane protein